MTKSITSQVATNQGDTIYACLTDGYGTYVATATERIDNIDKTKPTDTATATVSSITITNKQTDAGSGIAKIEYSSDNGATWQSDSTFTKLKPKTTYTIKTRVTDKAGNVTVSQSATATTSKIMASQVRYTLKN